MLSRLIINAEESADATDSGRLFQSMIVLTAKENLYSVVYGLMVSNFLVLASFPLAGLDDGTRSR